MATSPTQRSLAECRRRRWEAGVVERWLPRAHVRKDLFGAIDIIALDDLPGCLGIQACGQGGTSSHLKKLMAEPRAERWVAAGNRLTIWEWRRVKAGVRLRETPVEGPWPDPLDAPAPGSLQ